MIRLLFMALPISAGIAIGIWYERSQMRTECRSGAGDWTGSICVGSELLQ